MFGGDNAAGFCVACGYELSEDEAYERAVEAAFIARINDGT
jgi:hypothetical protein